MACVVLCLGSLIRKADCSLADPTRTHRQHKGGAGGRSGEMDENTRGPHPGVAGQNRMRGAVQGNELALLPRLRVLDSSFAGPVEPRFNPLSPTRRAMAREGPQLYVDPRLLREGERRFGFPGSRVTTRPPIPAVVSSQVSCPSTNGMFFDEFFAGVLDDDQVESTVADPAHRPRIRRWFWRTNHVYNIYSLNQDVERWRHKFPYMLDSEFRAQHAALLARQIATLQPVYSDDSVERYVRGWLETFSAGWTTFAMDGRTFSLAILGLHGFHATRDTLQIINQVPHYLHSRAFPDKQLNLGFIYGPITEPAPGLPFQPAVHRSKLVEIHLCVEHDLPCRTPGCPSRFRSPLELEVHLMYDHRE